MEGNQRNEEFSGICQMSRKFLHLKFEDTTAYLHADGNDLVMRIFQFNYLSSESRMEKTQSSIFDGRKKV